MVSNFYEFIYTWFTFACFITTDCVLTCIARINDIMWSELFVANKAPLLEQMTLFIDKFNELKTMLETEDIDSMRAMMRHSTERRALFDKK